MIGKHPIDLKHILVHHKMPVAINLLLLVIEIALMALVPLFIGFAIDGLLVQNTQDFLLLIAVLAGLVCVSVSRRFYDTRAYGAIRVKVQNTVVERNQQLTTSVLNARLEMARELVDFLEENVAQIINAIVQFIVSLTVLYFLNPALSGAALLSAIAMILIYTLFHRRFYRLNGAYNEQHEQQVHILEAAARAPLQRHFGKLMKLEVKQSDSEALLYGMVFVVLLAMIAFNLWYATLDGSITAGTIFSIVSYSWEFVEASIVLPITLQSLTRLSEITTRINHPK